MEQYHRMGEAGILRHDDHVELIEGELIEMAPIGPFHAGLVNLLNELLGHRVRGRAIACVQNPIRLDSHSEPQPDFALLRYRPDYYKNALPTPGDVLLLVEIADSSLRYDREIKRKRPLHARHGIPEFWLINVTAGLIEIHREPDAAKGLYWNVTTASEGLLAPASFPEVTLDVRELLS
jgi:Uma2 family endonuclease